jgi:hypothetical protein
MTLNMRSSGKLLARSWAPLPDSLWDRIGTIVDAFAPQECANYFKQAGYA